MLLNNFTVSVSDVANLVFELKEVLFEGVLKLEKSIAKGVQTPLTRPLTTLALKIVVGILVAKCGKYPAFFDTMADLIHL